MFIVNGKNGLCATYYTRDIRFDYVFGGRHFRLTSKVFDALAYFGLYKSVLRMETDPLLKALSEKRCTNVKLESTAAKDGFGILFHEEGGAWAPERVSTSGETHLAVVRVALRH